MKNKSMMKKMLLCVCTVALLFTMTACNRQEQPEESLSPKHIAGKTFVYEKEGVGGEFAIQLYIDGTFSYSEGMLSSHIGMGKWTLEEGVLTLTDSGVSGRVNHFYVIGNDLIYLSEGSTNFLYVNVADGEKFSVKQE